MSVYKLLIVDDEPWIREGLNAMIPRISSHWQVVATAADGEEAMFAIDQYRPHMVITDICMPNQDGIELHKWIRSHYPATHVLVLSGYADFEFARQSFSLGAADYLIKPVQDDLLESRLEVIYQKLESEQMKSSKLVKEQQFLMEFWFNHLLLPQQYEIQTCEGNLASYGFPVDQVHYTLICVINNEYKDLKDSNTQKATQYFIMKTMQELCSSNQNVFLGYDRNIYTIIWAMDEVVLKEYLHIFSEDLVLFLTSYTTFTFAIGASPSFSSLYDFPNAGDQAKIAATSGLALRQKSMLHWNQLSQHDIHGINLTKLGKSLILLFQQEEPAKLSVFLQKTLAPFYDQSIVDFDSIEKILMFILLRLEEMQSGKTDYSEPYAQTANLTPFTLTEKLSISPLHEIIETISSWFQHMISVDPSNHNKTETPKVEHIKQYISENLGYDLSLQSVGKQFYLNPSYLSSLFKQETGENFIPYITRMRIKKAKLLLADLHLNVNEISEQIGYASKRHFTKLFKEEVGMGPSDYRRVINQGSTLK